MFLFLLFYRLFSRLLVDYILSYNFAGFFFRGRLIRTFGYYRGLNLKCHLKDLSVSSIIKRDLYIVLSFLDIRAREIWNAECIRLLVEFYKICRFGVNRKCYRVSIWVIWLW